MDTKKEAGKQMRFSENELALFRGAFYENDDLVKLLRKVFLPELDPKAPLGQNIDLWMTLDLSGDPEQAIINLKARNLLITHIEQRLMEIKTLANLKDETPDEVKARQAKDSTK